MLVVDEIRERLETAFSPESLEVIDDSASHAGHANAPEGGQSHFQVAIRAPAFAEMTRVARERAVHKALGPDLIGRIHALALKIES